MDSVQNSGNDPPAEIPLTEHDIRRWVGEADALAAPPSGSCVVQFRGMAGKFEPFLGEVDWVREQLLAITRPEHLAGYRAARPAPSSSARPSHTRRPASRRSASHSPRRAARC